MSSELVHPECRACNASNRLKEGYSPYMHNYDCHYWSFDTAKNVWVYDNGRGIYKWSENGGRVVHEPFNTTKNGRRSRRRYGELTLIAGALVAFFFYYFG